MFDNLKARVKRMAEAWVDTGDGSQYPEGADTSQHSGDDLAGESLDLQIANMESALEVLKAKREGEGRHVHEWHKGQLPGGIEIHTCKTCGKFEKV